MSFDKSAYYKTWKLKNKERLRDKQIEYRRKHYLKHKEAVLRKNKLWKKANPDKKYIEDKEKVKLRHRIWSRKNKERLYTKSKVWVLANPQIRKKSANTYAKKNYIKSSRTKQEHQCAHHVFLRSPRGIVYEVNNICEFVRQNGVLFNEEDTIWRTGNYKESYCNASRGLPTICPYTSYTRKVKKFVRGQWKGWTYISELEKFEHAKNL